SEAVAQGSWPPATVRPEQSLRIRLGNDCNGLVTVIALEIWLSGRFLIARPAGTNTQRPLNI
ncbi:MAG: hypothetical protein WBR56_21815, partial [Sedimenticolaceae bacterium]